MHEGPYKGQLRVKCNAHSTWQTILFRMNITDFGWLGPGRINKKKLYKELFLKEKSASQAGNICVLRLRLTHVQERPPFLIVFF